MLTIEQAFLRVVEAGSFKKAAEYLNMETSSLSRKVAALEKRLNIKLLYRSTSKTQPTEAGIIYYEGLRRIVDEQMVLEETLSQGRTTLQGKLRIGSTVDLGQQFIAPVISTLRQQAPELSFELVLSSDFVDLGAEHLDIAIRIGSLPDSALVAKRLGEISRVLVASPDYLERYHQPLAPDDLEQHTFVLYSPAQNKVDVEFLNGQRFPSGKIHSVLCANSLMVIRDWVRGGAGIHWGPKWLYQDDLESGQVLEILPALPVKGFTIYAVYPARAFLSHKTKWFMHHLAEALTQYD